MRCFFNYCSKSEQNRQIAFDIGPCTEQIVIKKCLLKSTQLCAIITTTAAAVPQGFCISYTVHHYITTVLLCQRYTAIMLESREKP